ncbi:fungal hydrophobin [Coprinellus micaceus]|uniref:Hydrophobin n=1 Tax=Coprinellus micaceus TaxID=71717 RepID=A0A4Y7SMI8_COPMI|nr:fungal hydrophobin [Coprinellus micaceus]
MPLKRLSLALSLAIALPSVTAQCGGGGGGGGSNPPNNPPPWFPPTPIWLEQCDTDQLLCCMNVQEPSHLGVTPLLAMLGVDAQGLTGYVGSNCSPITAVGVTNGNCLSQLVCCSNDGFGGIVALGCVPVIG